MSWLGALRGVGKASTEYGNLLGEQKKNEWETKQAELQYQRQTNLENLRAQNTQKLQTSRQEYQTGESEKAREFQGAQTDKGYDQQIELEGMRSENNQANTKLGYKLKKEGRKDDLEYAGDVARQNYSIQEELTTGAKKKRVAALQGTPEYQEATPEMKKTLEFKVEEPELFNLLNGAKVKDEDKIRAYSEFQDTKAAYKESYGSLDKKMQRHIAKGTPKGETPEDFYAEHMALKNSPKWMQDIVKDSGGLMDSGEGPKVNSLTKTAKAKLISDIKSGDPEAQEAYTSLSEDLKAEIDAKIEGNEWKSMETVPDSMNTPTGGALDNVAGMGGLYNPNRERHSQKKDPSGKEGILARNKRLRQERRSNRTASN